MQQAGNFLQRRIVARQPGDPGSHAIEIARTGGFAIGQRFERKAGAVDQACGVPQALVFEFESGPFIPGKSQGIEFADLPFELFALAFQRLGTGRGRVQCLPGFTPSPVSRGNLLRQGGQPGVSIEQHPLRVATEQRLMGMLTVDIDQELTNLSHLLGSRRRAVDITARTAAGIEHPAQDQLVLGSEVVGGQPGDYLRQPADLEGGCDLGPLATGAHDAGIGAVAERQRQRIDQDRLAGPGFPGQRAKTGGKLEFQPIDDDKVANRKVAQHQGPLGRSLQCSFWRSIAK